MSNDSGATNLISKDPENIVAENNVEKTGENIKRNYCYVCKVQCTSPRNYVEHQKGKKHLKNISLVGNNKQTAQVKKKKGKKKLVKTKTTKKQSWNLKRKAVISVKSSDLHNKNSFREEQNTINSDTVDKLSNVTMHNFNSSAQSNQYDYTNQNYDGQNYGQNYDGQNYDSQSYGNHYSKYQNYGHYPNNYRNDNYYSDGRHYDYQRWNSQFSNSNKLHNSDFRPRNQYYTESAPSRDDYVSENKYAFSKSYENFENNSDSKSLEAAKQIPFWSNLSSSKNISKPSRKYYSDDSIPPSEPPNEKAGNQKTIIGTNQLSHTTKDSACTSKTVTNISQIIHSQYKVNNRMRSRSLSSSEIEKNIKDKNEGKIDSDATEEDRIKEWTNSLLETSHNQISRLINPSNYKEKAALKHLITKFSKSKRKILLSLRSNSLDSNENNDEDVATEETRKSDASGNSVSKDIDTGDKSSILDLRDTTTSEVFKSKRKSKNNDSDKDIISENIFDTRIKKLSQKQSPKKSIKSVVKSKNKSSTSSNLSSESRKGKSSSSICKDLSSESRKGKNSSNCTQLPSESRKENNSRSICSDLSSKLIKEKNCVSICSDLSSELRKEKNSSSICSDLSSESRKEKNSSSTCSDLSSVLRKEKNSSSAYNGLSSELRKEKLSSSVYCDLPSESRKEKNSSSAYNELSSESRKEKYSSSICKDLSSESRKEKNSSSICKDLSSELRKEKNSSISSDLPSESRKEKNNSSTCHDLSSGLRKEKNSSSRCSGLSSGFRKEKNSSTICMDLSSESRKEKNSSSAYNELSSESRKEKYSSSICKDLSSDSRKEKNSSSICKNLSSESRKEKNSSISSDLPSESRKEKNSSSTCSDLSSGLRKEKNSSSSCSGLSSELRKQKSGSVYKGKEKYVKRKSSGDDAAIEKKQKTESVERFETANNTKAVELPNLNNTATSSEIFKFPDSTQTSCEFSPVLLTELKEEVMEHCDVNETVSSTTTSSEKVQDQNLPFSSEISVETLIQLFASGSVKVKEEFNDPVMEAIKNISPDELVNACSSQFLGESESLSKSTFEKNTASQDKIVKDKSGPEISAKANEVRECVYPAVVNSAVINEIMTPTSIPERSDFCMPSASASDNLESQKRLSSNNDKNFENSLSDVENLNILNQTRPEMPSHLNELIVQLQDISTQEETVKQNLTEAKSKISEYTNLLEEWKNKKKKLQEQEEILRKQRNDIIKSMQSAAKLGPDDNEEEPTSSLPEERTLLDQPIIATKHDEPECVEVTISPEKSHASSSSSVSYQEKQKLQESPESDDITILPPPMKPEPPEIIICDDEETSLVASDSRINLGKSRNLRTPSNSRVSRFNCVNSSYISDNEAISPLPVMETLTRSGSTLRESRNKAMNSVPTNERQSFYDFKTMNAHPTVINSLVVFEEFLYTCSNDSTAKRFSLKDSSLTVTYLHAAKNVTEIVVEKVQNEALVFTSCSTRVISLFIASSGTKIKSFFPPCAVMSICKGWGKFYSGLANGSVNVYNWKYEEIEIVKTEQQPASRIATAHQGRLHVLVILSSEGNISIRDAETGLLIRYIKIYIRHPSWMCLHQDLVYLSSADKSLIILDVMSGREEKRLYMSSHATGLAVYDDYIFTISYSGIINCCNKDNSSDKKLYFGAGKSSLTCVHVYRDWVFTGNRKGDVSVFHFDPDSTAVCEFAKCDMIYGLKEDLEYHVEKDHLSKKKNLLLCNWKGCNFTFPRNADNVDKMNHLKVHIHEVLL